MLTSRRTALRVTVAAMTLILPASARAVESEVYENFSDTKGLTLGGNAATAKTKEGTVLRLTGAEEFESGSVFASRTIDANSFSTAFSFRMADPGGEADPKGHKGGDGLTFAVQPISASLGGSGLGLGIGGVSPSVAVEFDTWDDTCADFPEVCDPSSNHIGIDVNGDVDSVKTAEVKPAMDDGKPWYAWIDYDGTTLEVRLNETGVRPPDAQLSRKIDIPMTLGGKKPVAKAYVGFTAATGLSWQTHDIISWNYTASFVDGGVSSIDAGTPSPMPEDSGCSCRVSRAPRTRDEGIMVSLLMLALCARRGFRGPGD